MKSTLFVILLAIVALTGCGGNDGSNLKGVPQNSQRGWTPELIHSLIACQPNPGDVCDCTIPKITAKYTPEQVKEKSPYVAADMLAMRHECDASESPVAKAEPISAPANGYGYEIKGNNCETGKHQFSSLIQLCSALQSEQLNNNCAKAEREDLYKKFGCPGA